MNKEWRAWAETIERRLAKLERRSLKCSHDTLMDAVAKAIVTITEDTLEKRRVLRDAGIWRDDQIYSVGAGVTHKGALWSAQIANKASRPGESNCWRLLHKTPRQSNGR